MKMYESSRKKKKNLCYWYLGNVHYVLRQVLYLWPWIARTC